MPQKKPSPRKTRGLPGAAGASRGRKAGAPVPVVGIGASAGGLEAFTELLKHLPLDTGMAFVLVQHLDPQHESALAQILSRATRLPVREVTHNRRVEPNRVYIIPPNTSLGIARGVLKLLPREETRAPHHSVDFFFESLARDVGERAIGVILSGTASDGTLGLEAIKAAGGITFAQDASARYDSMPRSSIAEGCVDFVLSPQEIARELARIARHPYVAGARPARARAGAAPVPEVRGVLAGGDPADDPAFRKILVLLRNRSGVDFSLYKTSTIKRRIDRRALLAKAHTLDAYTEVLRGSPAELDALYSDLLISVTGFFRNPEAFDAVKRKVFARLPPRRGEEPFRIWAVGTSTGQEAYSLAMAFVEATEKATAARKLQVFATDLNEALLDKARQGLYARSLVQDVSPERLRRFFVAEEGGYRVVKSLREMVVFARHNLISDPPFSRIDLVSCRNLMIYLEPALQQKVLPTLHYALKPTGHLFLGASESIGNFGKLFDAVDRRSKIYVKKGVPTSAHLLPLRQDRGDAQAAARFGAAGGVPAAPRAQPDEAHPELAAQREADRVTVNQFAPPAVLINNELEILQFRGPTGAYLEPPTGKASFDLLKMAREGLMLPLRATINRAKKDGKTARKQDVRVQQNGATRAVNIEVIPLRNLRQRCYLVVFEDAGRARAGAGARAEGRAPGPRPGTREESRRVAELEADLNETRDYLQSIQEQYEASNEELQASNEEVQSANEELQSLNEELETSKEELQSANEELTTVNEEMSVRNVELSRLNSDLINLQASARLAIVVLNRDLTVRRFSTQAAKQFDLVASDLGRPIGHVRHHLDLAGKSLESFVGGVIADMRERERETRDEEGRWYSLRVHPYFTLDNRVDGAVLVLVDIDSLKNTEQAIRAARDYAEFILHTVREPLLLLHPDLHVHRANEPFYVTYGVSPAPAQGQLVYELNGGQWDIPRLHELLEVILPRDGVCENFELTHKFGALGERTLLINARWLKDERGQPGEVLLDLKDVTGAANKPS